MDPLNPLDPAAPAATPPEPAPAGDGGQPRTFTQDEVNRLMGRTRDEGRSEVLKKLGLDSLDTAVAVIEEHKQLKQATLSETERVNAALEVANRQIQELTDAKAALELQSKAGSIAAIKSKVATELNIPEALAARLSGETEEEIRVDAQALLAAVGKPGPSAPDLPVGATDQQLSPEQLEQLPEAEYMRLRSEGKI